ncbi:hypothetical protein [Bradyrhizobium sp. Ai1a-2]|uniref:hypothetical protein n=1 Tax=Bradyrhizobium sp. Ai1a-2 TaxID=196490 RepID=UPI0004030CE4|nr:hypothetical protein [Bradyrhizobium sp. Ai1a-2]
MKDFQHGHHVVECDSCDEIVQAEHGEDWNVFWSRAKREGWKATQVGADWVHGCPRHDV